MHLLKSFYGMRLILIILIHLFIFVNARPILLESDFEQGQDEMDYNIELGDGFLDANLGLDGIAQNKLLSSPSKNTDIVLASNSIKDGFIPNQIDIGNRVVSKIYNTINDTLSMTPEYMLELYNNLSKTSSTIHDSNIIRSFNNLPQNDTEDVTHYPRDKRIHSLVFDISTLTRRESINSAELRLYTLITRDQRSFSGVSRLVTIYEVIDIPNDSVNKKYNFITSNYIRSSENAWESFDVTAALKRSIRDIAKREHFQVRIQSLYSDGKHDSMDINAVPNDVKHPLLVVYSNDNSQQHERNIERQDILHHQYSSVMDSSYSSYDPSFLPGLPRNVYSSRPIRPGRSKRSRASHRNSVCRKRPMYVNFEDIDWQTWIIAPRGYQANQCVGRCYFPFNSHLNPTKHAIIQTLLHTGYPKKFTRSCCVPTKLDPISVLYIDEGVVTYKYKYDGMVVSECGCR